MKNFTPKNYRIYQRHFKDCIIDEEGNQLKYNKKKVPISVEKFTFDVTKDGKTVEYQKLVGYAENQLAASNKNGETVNINLKTGAVSDVYVDRAYHFFLDNDGKIVTFDNKGVAVDTGYTTDGNFDEFKKTHVLKVKNSEGKYGYIDDRMNELCPFVSESGNFMLKQLDDKINFIKDYDSRKIHILDRDMNELFSTDFTKRDMFNILSNNFYTIRDKKNDTTTIYEFNVEKNSFDFVYKCDGLINGAARDKDNNLFFTTPSNMFKLENGKVTAIFNERTKVFFKELDGQPIAICKKIDDNLGNFISVYSLNDNKTVLDASKELVDVDLTESCRMEDGSFRFFAREKHPKDELTGYWGVINSEGEELVPFVYEHSNGGSKQTYIRKDGRREVTELLLKDKEGQLDLFNIREKNIIATDKEIRKVKFPSTKEKLSYYCDSYEPTLKRFSASDKILGATLVTAMTGKVHLGMLTYGVMSMFEMEND